MKIIVCGAGQVGMNIARQLTMENHDVTIVDQVPDLVRRVSDTLDAQAVVGHASNPDVLEKAGIADADMLIAVTLTDEINMVACQVAHSLFDVPTKIARIRQQAYLEPMWAPLFSRDHLPIDVIISPEREVARAVARRLQIPGAIDMITLADGAVTLLAVRCNGDCPLVNTPLRQLTQLFPDLNIVIVGLVRDGSALVPKADDQMLPGDEAYFVVDTGQISRAMTTFGYEEREARRLLIIGGGNIGLVLAQELEREYPWVKAKIIESRKERAEEISGQLESTVVLNGDARDLEILEEANIRGTDTVVAVTNDDESNILASLLAKKFGCDRTVTLVNTSIYEQLIGSLGIDVVVSPRNITVSSILQHVRRGRIHSVHAVREDLGELIEAEALETSELVGKPIKDINLPAGVVLGAIVRDGGMLYPRGSTEIHAGDRIILFSSPEAIQKVESLFAVQLEYF
ncbi:MAG: Trk system potassium transporter TrkA [Rhodospirillaceae bacterium]